MLSKQRRTHDLVCRELLDEEENHVRGAILYEGGGGHVIRHTRGRTAKANLHEIGATRDEGVFERVALDLGLSLLLLGALPLLILKALEVESECAGSVGYDCEAREACAAEIWEAVGHVFDKSKS